jgi:hypothetical protein
LFVGQITALVLLGLVGFLYFERQGRLFPAGLFLALTTIKPHLAYIIMPIILLDALVRWRWQLLAGFLLPVVGGTAVAFFFRPSFLADYIGLMGSGRVLSYQPPTLSFMLSLWLGWPSLRLIALAILPLCLALWWFKWRKQNIDWLPLTAAMLLLSVMTAPYGWSFDVMVLLVPILLCTVWLAEKQIQPFQAVILVALFFLANILLIYQRSLGVSEEAFFWFPLFLAVLCAWCYYARSKKRTEPVSGQKRDSS